jgi:hypothetical protein
LEKLLLKVSFTYNKATLKGLEPSNPRIDSPVL